MGWRSSETESTIGTSIGRLDQCLRNANLDNAVPGIRDHLELASRPRFVKFPGADGRANHIIASLNDNTGDLLKSIFS